LLCHRLHDGGDLGARVPLEPVPYLLRRRHSGSI
jgi:hypothetical protein